MEKLSTQMRAQKIEDSQFSQQTNDNLKDSPWSNPSNHNKNNLKKINHIKPKSINKASKKVIRSHLKHKKNNLNNNLKRKKKKKLTKEKINQKMIIQTLYLKQSRISSNKKKKFNRARQNKKTSRCRKVK